jgi:GT2 family glycosyltransferase
MSMRHVAGASGAPAGYYDADVVILSLNRTEETQAAIHSALAQTGVSRHVFVVDQGSRRDTVARLAAIVAGRPDVSLVALDCNHGVAGGRNRGTALGHGRVIVGLDNDAEVADPGTLARAVAALDADEMLAAIGCRIIVHATGADDLASWGYPVSLLRAGDAFDAVTFVGAGHAIRRAAWNACGGYDEALFFCWEEFDFCLRAIALGWRIRYRGDIVIRHKVSAEHRVAWSGTRWFYFVRNRRATAALEKPCAASVSASTSSHNPQIRPLKSGRLFGLSAQAGQPRQAGWLRLARAGQAGQEACPGGPLGTPTAGWAAGLLPRQRREPGPCPLVAIRRTRQRCVAE